MTVKPFVKICMRQRPLGASSGPKRAPAQAHFAARRASFPHGCCCSYPRFRAGAGTDPAVAYYPHTAAGNHQPKTKIGLKKTYEIPNMDRHAGSFASDCFGAIEWTRSNPRH